MNKNNLTSSFTLIELLVVIAIIGGLSTLVVPNFMGARERSRDTQRKSDLKQIQKTLELYKQDQTPIAYPTQALAPYPPPDNYSYLDKSGSTWTSGNNTYMNYVPQDPIRKNPDGSAASYFYLYNNDLTYTLCACLENTADTEGVSGNCDNTTYICSSGLKYVVNEP